MNFLKMPIFDKKVIFLKNGCSDRSETLHVGAQDNFEKMNFENGGSRDTLTFDK